MDQLIAQLEQKIRSLVTELNSAKQEIGELRSQLAQQPNIAPDPLISSMEGLPAADQLQLYIADSLDLSSPSPATDNKLDEEQLSFDLGHKASLGDLFADADADKSSQSNKQQRNKNQKNNLRLVKLLESRYPKAFNWSNPQPLKIGIDQDITLDEELTKSKLKRALAAYTRSNRYKKCLKKTSDRIDLNGQTVEHKKKTTKPQKHNQSKAPKSPQSQVNKTNDNDEYQDLSSEERLKLKLAKLTGNKF